MQPTPVTARKTILFVTILLALSYYVRASWLHYDSYRYASQNTIEAVKTACRLEPGNSDNLQLLGALQFTAFDLDSARASLKKAAEANPWDARTWLLLATIYNVAGETSNQQAALDAAYAADPKTPEVAWEVGNFYLVRGEERKALQLFRSVVLSGADQTNDAFRISWQAIRNIDVILKEMMPPSVDAHLRLLSFLIQKDELDAASKVWDTVVAFRQPVPLPDSNRYVDFLIAKQQVDRAIDVWKQSLASNHANSLQSGNNLVVNGDFEEPISGGGFDWHYMRNGECSASIDDLEGKTGTRSLTLEMFGAFQDAGIFEYVPVQPGERYEMSAFMKSNDIQSSSGPRLGVFDTYSGQQYAMTDDMLETNVWREQSAEFTAGPNTHLVTIKIVRVPGNTGIKGKLWIDNVRLWKR